MKGSVATTARGGEMPNITAESAMAFVLGHTATISCSNFRIMFYGSHVAKHALQTRLRFM